MPVVGYVVAARHTGLKHIKSVRYFTRSSPSVAVFGYTYVHASAAHAYYCAFSRLVEGLRIQTEALLISILVVARCSCIFHGYLFPSSADRLGGGIRTSHTAHEGAPLYYFCVLAVE